MEQLKATDYFLIILGIWLFLLSFVAVRAIGYWRKLTKGATSLNLDQILQNVIARQEESRKQIAEIGTGLSKQQKQALGHIQKYALIRFNPFEDAGGDQSFVIALLDGVNNGVVISSLHARGGTRIYAKPVIGAKPVSHQFSKEEKEAVEKAARPA